MCAVCGDVGKARNELPRGYNIIVLVKIRERKRVKIEGKRGRKRRERAVKLMPLAYQWPDTLCGELKVAVLRCVELLQGQWRSNTQIHEIEIAKYLQECTALVGFINKYLVKCFVYIFIYIYIFI